LGRHGNSKDSFRFQGAIKKFRLRWIVFLPVNLDGLILPSRQRIDTDLNKPQERYR
jgi:hypothetical protein